MRTNEERIVLMHQRADQIERENRTRKVRLFQAGSFAVASALVIVMAFFVRHLSQLNVEGRIPAGMAASIFAQSEMLGLIIVAIGAFLLGVAVTIFCYYLKRWNENEA